MQSWIEEELRAADLDDKRLNARFKLLMDRMSHKPSLKFPAACRGRAEVEAAYRETVCGDPLRRLEALNAIQAS
jgi:hypothetical protein